MSNSNSIPLPTHPRFKDLTGQVFGRLTVLSYTGTSKRHNALWHTLCSCGTRLDVISGSLISGNTRSCGCLKIERIAKLKADHGLADSPEYTAWRNMWRRCTDGKHKQFYLYKDRTPPPEWRSLEQFIADMGPRPGSAFSLDRIDNEKPYGPGNCRWATDHTQTRNTSQNVWVTTPEGQRVILKDACAMFGLVYGTVQSRRRRGSDIVSASNGLFKEAA